MVLAPVFPVAAPTLVALQDVIAFVAGVEKMVWCEGHAAMKHPQAGQCTVLEPAGLRQFVKEGTLNKLRKCVRFVPSVCSPRL